METAEIETSISKLVISPTSRQFSQGNKQEFFMRRILIATLLVATGCAPSGNRDTISVTETKAACSSMAAAHRAAKSRKNQIEALAVDKRGIDIEEALFSWPSIVAERIGNLSDANAASKKMRELKKEMKNRNCEGIENLD